MTLHMIRLEVLTDRLMNIGLRKKLPMYQVDTGYLVHCQLAELFGHAAPKPFLVDNAIGRKLVVLGYCEHDHAELGRRTISDDPDLRGAIVWPELASKPMPQAWRPGMKLGFSLRACPIVRTKHAGPHDKRNKGSLEVDAFVHACWKAGPEVQVDREQVYRDWLTRQLDTLGGARVVDVKLSSFKRDRLSRRTHEAERRAHACERPDITFDGTLEITDPVKFGELLRRGVGRHRAFGFGMLRVRSV